MNKSQGFFQRSKKKKSVPNVSFCLTNCPKLKKKLLLQSFKMEKKKQILNAFRENLAIFAKQNYSKNESIIDRVGM